MTLYASDQPNRKVSPPLAGTTPSSRVEVQVAECPCSASSSPSASLPPSCITRAMAGSVPRRSQYRGTPPIWFIRSPSRNCPSAQRFVPGADDRASTRSSTTHDPVVSGVPEHTDPRILRVFSGTKSGSVRRIRGELTASIFHSRLDPVTGKTRRARSSPDASSMSHSMVIPRADGAHSSSSPSSRQRTASGSALTPGRKLKSKSSRCSPEPSTSGEPPDGMATGCSPTSTCCSIISKAGWRGGWRRESSSSRTLTSSLTKQKSCGGRAIPLIRTSSMIPGKNSDEKVPEFPIAKSPSWRLRSSVKVPWPIRFADSFPALSRVQ